MVQSRLQVGSQGMGSRSPSKAIPSSASAARRSKTAVEIMATPAGALTGRVPHSQPRSEVEVVSEPHAWCLMQSQQRSAAEFWQGRSRLDYAKGYVMRQ